MNRRHLFFPLLLVGVVLGILGLVSLARVPLSSARTADAFSTPYLVKNINAQTDGSDPDCVALGDEVAVCTADDGLPGTRLWRSDGTVEGSYLLKELSTSGGEVELRPEAVTTDGRLYFYFKLATRQLWVTDGSPDGTKLVKEFKSEQLGPGLISAAGKGAFFLVGVDSVRSVWFTDGTEEGTERIISEVNKELAIHRGKAYFAKRSGLGIELWSSDGTKAGTDIVADIYPGATSSNPHNFVSTDRFLYFEANSPSEGRSIWLTDGTASRTRLVRSDDERIDHSDLSRSAALGDLIFWTGEDNNRRRLLWRSDGSRAGTFAIKLGNTGYIDALTSDGRLVNAYVKVEAYDTYSWWRSDGTPGGTFQVDTVVHSQDCDGRRTLRLGDAVYFARSTTKKGCELWSTEDSSSAVTLVQDIIPGLQSSKPVPLVLVNSLILMRASARQVYYQTYDAELWATNGSSDGAHILLDINQFSDPSEAEMLNAFDGILYLNAFEGGSGRELWRSDGSEAGTSIVANINPEPPDLALPSGYPEPPRSSRPAAAQPAANGLVFTAETADEGRELWVTDGTEAGTEQLKSFVPGWEDTHFLHSASWNGLAFYSLYKEAESEYQFWRTDGSVEGTRKLGDYDVPFMAGGETVLYYMTRDKADRWHLGITDGLPGHTRFVSGMPSCARDEHDLPLATQGDRLYFRWCSEVGFDELWMLTGPDDEPGKVTQISAQNRAYMGDLAALGDYVYFNRYDSDQGTKLARSDGTPEGSATILDIPAYEIKEAEGGFYFSYYGLWFSDGTAEGTTRLSDWSVGVSEVIGKLLFYMTEFGLMVSDGTAAGTNLVRDMVTSEVPVRRGELFAVGQRLFFTGWDSQGDNELWALDVTPGPTAAFRASPEHGVPPLEVTFENLSSGDFDTCTWDFGDGRTKKSCDPVTHLYGREGTYDVSLRVEGPGGSDVKLDPACVHVGMEQIFAPAVMSR